MGRIIVIFLLIVAAIGIYGWLSGGAAAQIQALVPAFNNPLKSNFESQKGKVVAYNVQALAPKVPSIGSYTDSQESISGVHDEDTTNIERAKEFGTPSPARGTVSFQTSYGYGAANTSAQSEYVTIEASRTNTGPVTISGWTLKSAVSGNEARIGGGVTTYRMGAVSSQEKITLKPGETATINSGTSPLGVSFHTNACTGYLTQFQKFTPSLNNSCPAAANEMPNTLENLQTYGAACIDFVRTLPSCSYYISSFPAGVSDACRAFVSNALTYNSCVDRHQWQSGFEGSSWRIYLGSSDILWNHSHDVIRLLDASGRTVDVLSY